MFNFIYFLQQNRDKYVKAFNASTGLGMEAVEPENEQEKVIEERLQTKEQAEKKEDRK